MPKAQNTNTQAVFEYDNPAAVAAYLATLDHPLKPVVESIRLAILEADAAITEGIKWNSPSFYCYGWFATTNIRPKKNVLVVLHHGAKAHPEATLNQTIKDESALLTWMAADRAVVSFESVEDFAANRTAFVTLIRQWAAYQTQLAKTTTTSI